jgi:hypothetical protein
MTCIRGLVWLGAVILVAECASSCRAAAARGGEASMARFSPPSPYPEVGTRSSAALTVNVAVPRLVLQGT